MLPAETHSCVRCAYNLRVGLYTTGSFAKIASTQSLPPREPQKSELLGLVFLLGPGAFPIRITDIVLTGFIYEAI